MLCFSAPLSKELSFALNAAKTAVSICKTAPRELHRTKQDASPVCLADLRIQATVQHMLHEVFPEDALLAEENVNHDGIAHLLDFSPLQSYPTKGRTWVLDPIDGTVGFLSGGNYACGLALPGVAASLAIPEEGVILLAERGLRIVRVCEGKENARGGWLISGGSGHMSTWGEARGLCCGSLVKYAAIARGHAKAFVQVMNGRERVWDHAAGLAVVEASGGTVSDEGGREVMLNKDAIMTPGRAVVSTPRGSDHERVCELVNEGLKNGTIKTS